MDTFETVNTSESSVRQRATALAWLSVYTER
jgi:hypothetical protein